MKVELEVENYIAKIYIKLNSGYSLVHWQNRNINLNHILLAIEKVNEDRFYFGVSGIVITGTIEKVSEYDLSKPFSSQSPEFYSFLLEIIK